MNREIYNVHEVISEINSPQKVAVDVLSYLHSLKKIDHISKEYAFRRVKRSSEITDYNNFQSIYHRTKRGLEDLYFIDQSAENFTLDTFKANWGEEGDALISLFNQVSPKIETYRRKKEDRYSRISAIDKVRIALDVGRRLHTLTEEQQIRLLHFSGYEREEVIDIVKHVGLSAALHITLGGIAYPLIAAASTKGLTGPFLDALADPKTQLAIVSSYIAHYASLIGYGRENFRLLRNQEIRTSPNVLATGTFYLLNKLFPNRIKMQELGTLTATVAPVLLEEIGFIPLVFTPAGPSVLVARNIAATAFNTAVAIGSEMWLKTKTAYVRRRSVEL